MRTAGGRNTWGQLGDDSGLDSNVPVAVATSGTPLAGKNVTAIDATTHTCAVADGEASCWGRNDIGQLGNDSNTDSTVPVAVVTQGCSEQNGHNDHRRVPPHVRGGRRNGVLLGRQRVGAARRRQHHQREVPVAVDTTGLLAGKTITTITAGGRHTAVIAAPGSSVPQPPTSVAGATGDGTVTVSWSAPTDDGGSPVLDYTATANPSGKTCTTSTTSCEVSGLTNGTSYTFTATARNAKGVSAPSAPSAPFTPAAAVTPPPPVAPTAGTTPPPVQPVAPGTVTGVKAPVRRARRRSPGNGARRHLLPGTDLQTRR